MTARLRPADIAPLLAYDGRLELMPAHKAVRWATYVGHVRVSHIAVLRSLVLAEGRWVNATVLQAAFYNGQEQPDGALTCVRIAMHHLRLFLTQSDSKLRIRTKKASPDYPQSRYCLVTLGKAGPAPE